MKGKQFIFLNIFIFFFAMPLFSQTQQEQSIALEYLNKGEFDKAIGLYQKFYQNDPEVQIFYKNYVVCLMELKDLKTAEKVIKKQVKENRDVYAYQIDLGEFYKKTNEEKKAKQIFDELVKSVSPSVEKIDELGSLFQLINETDYAIDVYARGIKIMGDYPIFHIKIAELKLIKNDYPAMMNELLTVLSIDETQLSAIQTLLITVMDDNPESELNQLIKNTILKEAQKNTGKTIYTDFLIWFFIQQRNFDAAFIQSKALDKRTGGMGDKLMELGKICIENRKYDLAVKCFEYVISLGFESYNYINARIELLNTFNLKLKEDFKLEPEELDQLEANYISTIRDIGPAPQLVTLKIELSHLQAFYLNKINEAKIILNEIMTGRQGNAEQLAKAKMELADILVLENDLWEPSLLYGQVEKDFKNDVIGQEAKFRNAKLSFYRGEFEWAEAQMKVLKASTSKMIANDALALSLLIIDNSGMDTTYDALMMFARADLLFYQQKLNASSLVLDSIFSKYSNHPVLDEVLYKKAEIATNQLQFEKAIEYYDQLLKSYSQDILADDALFKMANLYERKLNNTPKAMELYQQLMVDFPGSMYVIEARKRFRQLRGDKIN